MLLGVLFGVIIMLLFFAVLWFKAQNGVYINQNEQLTAELANATELLRKIALIEQERIRLKEAVVINFTEEQITELAHRITTRVKTMMDAEQAAACAKLN